MSAKGQQRSSPAVLLSSPLDFSSSEMLAGLRTPSLSRFDFLASNSRGFHRGSGHAADFNAVHLPSRAASVRARSELPLSRAAARMRCAISQRTISSGSIPARRTVATAASNALAMVPKPGLSKHSMGWRMSTHVHAPAVLVPVKAAQRLQAFKLFELADFGVGRVGLLDGHGECSTRYVGNSKQLSRPGSQVNEK